MKQIRKFVLVSLCLVLCSLVFSGCQKTSSEEEIANKASIEAADIAAVEGYAKQQFADQLVQADYASFQSRVDSGEVVISRTFDIDLAQRWKTFTEKHGAVKKAEVIETNKTDDGYTTKIILTGDDSVQMALTVVYDKSSYPMSTILEDYTDDAARSISDKMGEAGGNIVIGLGIVFLVLIVLTLLISAMKYVNVIGKKDTKTPAESKKAAPPVIQAARPAAVPVSVQDNSALVAVITAAIAASEQTGTDGFTVRSIRRLNSNKWR